MPDVRRATPKDEAGIRAVHQAAFPAVERESVAALAVDLLHVLSKPETFSFVAVHEEDIVGHVAFSPVKREGTAEWVGAILAPLAVHPDFQHRGLGTRLIETGVEAVTSLGGRVVFVYGDSQYYGRFGFLPEVAEPYVPPCPLQYPFGWQAKPLVAADDFPTPGRLDCVPPLSDPKLW